MNHDAASSSRKSRTKWVLATLAIAVLGLWYTYRGHVRCYIGYPECNPFIKIAEERPWQIPTDPVEKKAYDYAHALKLPPGMPEPVPFDFKAARIAEGYGEGNLGLAYFRHLCKTEDVELIYRPVENVDGMQVMRPRGWMEVTPLNSDRYGAEEPTGYGWLNGDDQIYKEDSPGSGLRLYIQPLWGLYKYAEYEVPGNAGTYLYFDRADVSPAPYTRGIEANWRPRHWGGD